MSDEKSRDFAAGAAWMKEVARKVAHQHGNVDWDDGDGGLYGHGFENACEEIAAAIDAIPVPAAPPAPALDREAIAKVIASHFSCSAFDALGNWLDRQTRSKAIATADAILALLTGSDHNG